MESDEEILLYERRVKLREAETREEGIIWEIRERGNEKAHYRTE